MNYKLLSPVFCALTFYCLSLPLHAESHIYESEKLSNGMTLVSQQARKVPLVTILLTFKAGAMTESPDINGLTHVWEHMFFTGNKKLPDETAFEKKARELGMLSNAATSAEYVEYYFTVPSVHLDEALQLMADCIKTPSLAQKALEKERVVVLDEYDRAASRPGFDLDRVRRHLIYGAEQFRRDPLGKRDIIAKVNREQLLRIKSNVFVPSNAAILIGGDFEQDTLKAKVEKYFLDWKDPKDWRYPEFPDFPPLTQSVTVTETHKNAQNVEFTMTFKGPRVGKEDEDTIYADILAEALQHRSGAFYKKFTDSGLSLGSGLMYYTQGQAGEVIIHANAVAKNAKKMEAELEKEITEWSKETYFTDAQLEDVSRSMLIARKRDMNRPSEFIKTLTFSWTVTGLPYFDTYLTRLSKVTRKDLVKFVKTYLVDKPYIKAILTNPEEAKIAGYSENVNEYLAKFNLIKSGN